MHADACRWYWFFSLRISSAIFQGYTELVVLQILVGVYNPLDFFFFVIICKMCVKLPIVTSASFFMPIFPQTRLAFLIPRCRTRSGKIRMNPEWISFHSPLTRSFFNHLSFKVDFFSYCFVFVKPDDSSVTMLPIVTSASFFMPIFVITPPAFLIPRCRSRSGKIRMNPELSTRFNISRTRSFSTRLSFKFDSCSYCVLRFDKIIIFSPILTSAIIFLLEVAGIAPPALLIPNCTIRDGKIRNYPGFTNRAVISYNITRRSSYFISPCLDFPSIIVISLNFLTILPISTMAVFFSPIAEPTILALIVFPSVIIEPIRMYPLFTIFWLVNVEITIRMFVIRIFLRLKLDCACQGNYGW